MARPLNELLEGLSETVSTTRAQTETPITGLTADSRSVEAGYLFAAIPGARADGRDFIPQALEKGARAILAPEGTTLDAKTQEVSLITCANPRRALAEMAAAFYGVQPKTICAVTGTNGKTSVAEFLRQIWARHGLQAASLGTLGLKPDDAIGEPPASLTTPDPVELHRCLADLARGGYDHLAMEASSHGLDQFRLDGLKLNAAAFTNLSHDHLDYHGTMEAYARAKARLFAELLPAGGTAVLNADQGSFAELRDLCRARSIAVLSYGAKGEDLRLLDAHPHAGGLAISADIMGHRIDTDLTIVGAFQAHNLLAALGLAIASGLGAEEASKALPEMEGVRGRLERVTETAGGGFVFVDYAHTPDALETVLHALRPHAEGRLFVVFGCGGDRDKAKRAIMGEIAGRLADVAIVTDDNPRGEDPAAIRREILSAVPAAEEIGDRATAIASAIGALQAGDLLLIAGKGHEPGQIVGDTVLPFDDAEVARRAARRHAEGEVR